MVTEGTQGNETNFIVENKTNKQMNIEDIIELNDLFDDENKFSKDQLNIMINAAFANDKDWKFNDFVETFYLNWCSLDYSDCENFITDIQSGDHNAMETFISDIYNYFSSIPIYESNFLRKF